MPPPQLALPAFPAAFKILCWLQSTLRIQSDPGRDTPHHRQHLIMLLASELQSLKGYGSILWGEHVCVKLYFDCLKSYRPRSRRHLANFQIGYFLGLWVKEQECRRNAMFPYRLSENWISSLPWDKELIGHSLFLSNQLCLLLLLCWFWHWVVISPNFLRCSECLPFLVSRFWWEVNAILL